MQAMLLNRPKILKKNSLESKYVFISVWISEIPSLLIEMADWKSGLYYIKIGVLPASENFFWRVRFFSRRHFDHFYGSDDHKILHPSKEK
jgi:hypothetical protein